MQFETFLYSASLWVLPVVLAITLHEAAHGFVAHRLGDDTAYRLGRVTLNPLKHIDPVGTILMPAILLLLRVAVSIWIRQAGAGEFCCAQSPPARHGARRYRRTGDQHRARDARRSDVAPRAVCARQCRAVGGAEFENRAVGLLPNFLAVPFARLEPYGMMILITLLLFHPCWGADGS